MAGTRRLRELGTSVEGPPECSAEDRSVMCARKLAKALEERLRGLEGIISIGLRSFRVPISHKGNTWSPRGIC